MSFRPSFVPARRTTQAVLLAISSGVVSSSLAAQTPPPSGQVRISLRARPAAMVANACEELSSSPTALAQAPEGLALLRLRRELEGAMQALSHDQQLQHEQLRQMSQVQRGVDSAMKIVVRYFDKNGAPEEEITLRRSDSVRVTASGRTIDGRNLFISMDSTMSRVAPVLARTMPPVIDGLVRSLQPQVAALTGVAEARLASAAPNGYVGVSLSGAQVRLVSPEGVFTSHCEYPLVEAVDAGSPAEKAGLVAGDTLLAYNGRDLVQQAINYPELMVPGSTVRFRIRKSGRQREVPVTIVPRKDEARTMVMVRAPSAPRLTRDGEFIVREMSPSRAPVPPMPPAMASSGVSFLAGAQFSTIDEDFASTLDLEPGVLVLKVAPGSPAADAGLKPAEVVTRINGQRARDVAMLRKAVIAGGEIKLTVRSKSGERTVVLKGR